MARRATLLRTNAAEHLDDISEVDQALGTPARRRTKWLVGSLVALVVVSVLVVGAVVAGSWVQGRYYVGVSEDRVAVYNGVSQSLGPIQLSRVEETSDIKLDDLSPYSRSRVENTIPADNLDHAHSIVNDLRSDDAGDQASASASASPQDSGTVSFPSTSTPPEDDGESRSSPSSSRQGGDGS